MCVVDTHISWSFRKKEGKEEKEKKLFVSINCFAMPIVIDLLYDIKFPIILVHNRNINSSAITSSFNNLYEECVKGNILLYYKKKKQQGLLDIR